MKKLTTVAAVAAFSVFLITACAPSDDPADGGEAPGGTAESPSPNPTKNAYFGDLHVHTRYSFDAFGEDEHVSMDGGRDAWCKLGEAAEANNAPGNFTAFTA